MVNFASSIFAEIVSSKSLMFNILPYLTFNHFEADFLFFLNRVTEASFIPKHLDVSILFYPERE